MSEEITESFFTFGEPEEVHHANMLDYLNVFADFGGEYYIPPIDLSGLSLMRRANGHHGSCVIFRSKTTANAYISGPLPVQEFSSAVTDLLTFGNAYFQVLRNVFGNPTGLEHIPALNMRVKTKKSGYRLLKANGDYTDFGIEDVIHIKEYDTQQQIYGVPDWIGGFAFAKSKVPRTTANRVDQFTEELSQRLRHTQIFCRNALDVIERFDSKDTFFYLDPPYANSDCGHYQKGKDVFFDLLQLLPKLKGKWLLSSYPGEELNELRKITGANFRDVVKCLSVSGKHNAGKTKTECLTWNYQEPNTP